MIIDFHTHIFPEKIAQRAIGSLAERSGVQPVYDGTPEGLLSSMDRANVNFSVAVPIATKPKQVESINNFAMEVNRKTDRILSFGTMHPDYPNYREELDRLKKGHVLGIKMHPVYQDFMVNDDRVMPIYEYAQKLGLIVLLHAGMDVGFPGVCRCTPLRCRRIVDQFPKLKLVLAHMGGYELWDDVETYLIGEKVYLDTSFSSHLLGETRMKKMIQAHGTERILFGTDGPWSDPVQEIARIRAMGFGEAETENIFCNTAKELLRLAEI